MNKKKTRLTLSEQEEEQNLAVTLGEQGGEPWVCSPPLVEGTVHCHMYHYVEGAVHSLCTT